MENLTNKKKNNHCIVDKLNMHEAQRGFFASLVVCYKLVFLRGQRTAKIYWRKNSLLSTQLIYSPAFGSNCTLLKRMKPWNCFHRIGLGVAMSVRLCLTDWLCPLPMHFFQGLSLALRSHDQIPASHWSTPLLNSPILHMKRLLNNIIKNW